MALTCAQITECLPLPFEERERFARGNGQQPPPSMCPLGQFIYEALISLLYNAKCQRQMHFALNYDLYMQFGRRRTLNQEGTTYYLSLFLEGAANTIAQRRLQWGIVQTKSSKSRVILDSTMDTGAPVDGYLDIAADIGSYASRSIPRNIRHHPLADQSVGLIEGWLSECTRNHTECAAVTKEPKLPARVIDLGSVQESKPPRLLVTNGQTGAYLALSHCWGQESIFLTRWSNIEQLKEKIPVKKLPRTFIDAFMVARILRIRYIWIDSLCIIQDDPDDWEKEAQKMGLIYESSQCTIAATSSSSSSISFLNYQGKDFGTLGLSQREQMYRGLSRSKQMYPQDYSGSLFLPLLYDKTDRAKGTFYITQPRQRADPLLYISKAPLNKRGWVLQERLLSRRILHFAADQVYWECRSHALAQDGTVFRPKGPLDFLFPLPSLIHRVCSSSSDHQDFDEMFIQSWLHIIEFYSACNFSYEKDRLPALLGLADRLSRFTKREYVNGHWFELGSKELPNTLLWTACGQITRRPEKQVAPSWSWAAAEGELTFESARVCIKASLLRWERSDELGIPGFVALHISCQLLVAYPNLSLEEDQSRPKEIWKSECFRYGRKRSNMISDYESRFSVKSKLDQEFLGHITFDSSKDIPSVIDCMYLYCDTAGYTCHGTHRGKILC